MQPIALTPDALLGRLADRITGLSAHTPARVLIDGVGAAELAASLVEPLRTAGRPAIVIDTRGFWRPASLRLETGREDVEARRWRWLDDGALRREVLEPVRGLDACGVPGPGHRYLPSLWDPDRDRATRAGAQQAPANAVLLVHGALLLALDLPAELTVHVHLSAGALRRRLPPEDQWALGAFSAYEASDAPDQRADLVVRWDDLRRPALVDPTQPCI